MPQRCVCDRTPEAGPSTHHGPVHAVWLRQLSQPRCTHSTLAATTKRYRPRRIRPIPGTRRLIAIEIDAT